MAVPLITSIYQFLAIFSLLFFVSLSCFHLNSSVLHIRVLFSLIVQYTTYQCSAHAVCEPPGRKHASD